jgi:hypothetical protein
MTVIPVKGRHARADTVTFTRTPHTLPFGELSPRGFERRCLWLVERKVRCLALGKCQAPGAPGRSGQRTPRRSAHFPHPHLTRWAFVDRITNT